jgi:hypothetical protein
MARPSAWPLWKQAVSPGSTVQLGRGCVGIADDGRRSVTRVGFLTQRGMENAEVRDARGD